MRRRFPDFASMLLVGAMLAFVERPAITAEKMTRSEHATERLAEGDGALAAFDAALADIDQLLERLNRSSVDN